MRPQLYACPEAVHGLAASLNPPLPLPRLLKPLKLAVPPLVALSFAALPPWARRLYGAPGLATTDLATTIALRTLRRATTALPTLPEPRQVERARKLMGDPARSATSRTGAPRVAVTSRAPGLS
jgi:hypothetical protein